MRTAMASYLCSWPPNHKLVKMPLKMRISFVSNAREPFFIETFMLYPACEHQKNFALNDFLNYLSKIKRKVMKNFIGGFSGFLHRLASTK